MKGLNTLNVEIFALISVELLLSCLSSLRFFAEKCVLSFCFLKECRVSRVLP